VFQGKWKSRIEALYFFITHSSFSRHSSTLIPSIRTSRFFNLRNRERERVETFFTARTIELPKYTLLACSYFVHEFISVYPCSILITVSSPESPRYYFLKHPLFFLSGQTYSLRDLGTQNIRISTVLFVSNTLPKHAT